MLWTAVNKSKSFSKVCRFQFGTDEGDRDMVEICLMYVAVAVTNKKLVMDRSDLSHMSDYVVAICHDSQKSFVSTATRERLYRSARSTMFDMYCIIFEHDTSGVNEEEEDVKEMQTALENEMDDVAREFLNNDIIELESQYGQFDKRTKAVLREAHGVRKEEDEEGGCVLT